MRPSIPTTALVALYCSLAQVAAADGGSISALLERIASQHHKALPVNAVPSNLKAVTTILEAAASPTVLPSGSVVLAPKQASDKSAHKRMARAIKKRAFEGEEILARAAIHDGDDHRNGKRWVRANYIIQDGDTNPAVPTDGSNAVITGGSVVAVNTPDASIVAPSFPPVQASSAPADTPASVNTPHATIALPSFPPRPSATPAPAVSVASVRPAVSSIASAAVPNVLALASSVQAAASSSAALKVASVPASSAVSSAKPKATPIGNFFHNVIQGLEHDLERIGSAIAPKKSAAAVTSAPVAAAKEKRWTWATEIIQDGDSNAALPTDGSNVNLLSNGIDVATPVNSIVTPTFPPLSSAASATASPVVNTEAIAVAAVLEEAATASIDAAEPVATEASTLEVVQATVEEKLAAIAAGFAEAEAASASAVAATFSRQRREFELAHRNTKRVEKLVRRNFK